MINGFYSWVRSIAFYMVLVTMASYLMPNERYKKYLKFFTGILMIVLVIRPVMNVFGLEEGFNSSFLVESLKEEVNELRQDTKALDEIQQNNLVAGYEEELQLQIRKIVENRGLFFIRMQVEWKSDDSGALTGIQGLTVVPSTKENDENKIFIDEIQSKSQEVEGLEEYNLKNDIGDVYNIPVSNINISIQR